jgi:hypothetical protein
LGAFDHPLLIDQMMAQGLTPEQITAQTGLSSQQLADYLPPSYTSGSGPTLVPMADGSVGNASIGAAATQAPAEAQARAKAQAGIQARAETQATSNAQSASNGTPASYIPFAPDAVLGGVNIAPSTFSGSSALYPADTSSTYHPTGYTGRPPASTDPMVAGTSTASTGNKGPLSNIWNPAPTIQGGYNTPVLDSLYSNMQQGFGGPKPTFNFQSNSGGNALQGNSMKRGGVVGALTRVIKHGI